MFPNIDPDFLEALLSQTYEQVCVLCGRLAEALRYNNFDSDSWFKTKNIADHASLRAIDPDILFKHCPKVYPEKFFKLFDMEELYNNRLRQEWERKGIDIDEVKYAHDDRRYIEYYSTLFQRLYEQTNKLSLKELGERIIIAPKNFPKDFTGIEEMVSGIPDPTPVVQKLKPKAENNIHDLSTREFFALKDAEEIANDPERLEFQEKIKHHKEPYNRYINIDNEHRRIYTRARFMMNMLLDLQQYIKQNIVTRNASILSLDQLNIFLGFCIKSSLEHYNTIRLDIDEYPVFSRLYTHGSLLNRTFPGKQSFVANFCNTSDVIHFSLFLFESKTGEIYVILILEDTDYVNLLDYFDTIMIFYKFMKLVELGADVPNSNNNLFQPFTLQDFESLGRLHRGMNVDPNINVSLGNRIADNERLMEQYLNDSIRRMPMMSKGSSRHLGDFNTIQQERVLHQRIMFCRWLSSLESDLPPGGFAEKVAVSRPSYTDEEVVHILRILGRNLSTPRMTLNVVQQVEELMQEFPENARYFKGPPKD